MGAGNAKLAYARWHTLPDLPFRLLVFMALTSIDGDEVPAYWGGWESLALAAGRLVPPAVEGDKEVTRVRRAALKAVHGAVKVLLERGAVSVTEAAAPGRNTKYALNLANASVHGQGEPSDGADRSNGSRSADTTVHAEPAQRFTVTHQSVHGEREPEEYEDQVRTKPKDEEAGVRTAVTVPRAREADETPSSTTRCEHGVPPSLRCPACARGLSTVPAESSPGESGGRVIPFRPRVAS